MVMSRWDPVGEALSLREAMSRLFEQAVLQPGTSGGQGRQGLGFAPALDVSEDKDAYTVKANLPGVKPEDVNIELEQGVLTISGEIKDESQQPQSQPGAQGQKQGQQQQGTHHIRERHYGRFFRSITLPTDVDANKAEATFEHGVLTLRVPKAEATKPRKIQIQAGGTKSSGQQIEGSAAKAPDGSSTQSGSKSQPANGGSESKNGGTTQQEMSSTKPHS